MHEIAVADGVLEPPQHHHAGAAAHDGPARAVVEGAAVAVGRQGFVLPVQIALAVRHQDGHAARERRVALAREQTLTSGVDRHQ